MGHIVERLSGGAGVGTRHVCYTVVKHAFLFVSGIIMRRGAGGFGAASLIHGDGRIRDDACSDLVASLDEFRDTAGNHADAVFLGFDFFGDSDFHECDVGKLPDGGIRPTRT